MVSTRAQKLQDFCLDSMTKMHLLVKPTSYKLGLTSFPNLDKVYKQSIFLVNVAYVTTLQGCLKIQRTHKKLVIKTFLISNKLIKHNMNFYH